MSMMSYNPYDDVESVSDDEGSRYHSIPSYQLQGHRDRAMSDSEGPGASNRKTINTCEVVVKILRKHFISHENVVLKRAITDTSMSHCQRGLPIAYEYHRLRNLLVVNARLEFQKDLVSRTQQFEVFLRNLKELVKKESASWQAINNSKGSELENHTTNLTALSSICDEFRMHLNHWPCLKQTLFNNRWLRSGIPNMLQEIHKINMTFMRLHETAIWLIEKLLKTGMRVFAYVDRRSLTYNDVFSIVRGIEEFNTLIQIVRGNTQDMRNISFHETSHFPKDFILVKHMPIGSIDCTTMKTVPFIRLLHSLALEWAKNAVAITKHSLDNNQQLLTAMKQQTFPGAGDALEIGKLFVPHLHDGSDLMAMDTSDYFSESLNKTHDHTSHTVDLTSGASPLLDYGKKEKDYVSKVIQIACQRTNLIRKNKFFTFQNMEKRSTAQGDLTGVEENSEHFIRNEIKRKSVSWGDSHDSSVCRQLLSKYEDALWKAYGTELDDCLNYEIEWSKPGGHKSGIGNLDFCSLQAFKVFTTAVSAAANKGFFTILGSKQVILVLSNILGRCLVSWCDITISRCLASIQSDKGSPIMVANGSKSSKTAMLLRNAIGLITQQIHKSEIKNDRALLLRHTSSPAHHLYMDFKWKSSAVDQLDLIIDLTHKWCRTKAKQYLVGYKMSPFILVTYGDLLVLHKEMEILLKSFDGELFLQKATEMQLHLDNLFNLHNQMTKSFYDKASKLTHEIVQNQMPVKSWKMKQPDGMNSMVTQSYAESIVQLVLLPVAEGAADLHIDSQYSPIKTVLAAALDTWQQHCVNQKIKFSLNGASQLGVDFSHVLEFIDVAPISEETKAKVLQSSDIHRFQAIIKILSEQPTEKKSQPVRNMSRNRVAPIDEPDLDGVLTSESKVTWSNLRVRIPGKRRIFPCLPFF